MMALELTETIPMQTLQLTMMHPKKTAHNKLKLPLVLAVALGNNVIACTGCTNACRKD
jgi:hypothetical protein